MGSINNHIMITKSSIDMKHTVLLREFHKLSLYAQKTNFDFCPVLHTFAITPHIYELGNRKSIISSHLYPQI